MNKKVLIESFLDYSFQKFISPDSWEIIKKVLKGDIDMFLMLLKEQQMADGDKMIQLMDFTYSFRCLQQDIHINARAKGFYDDPPSDIERIALMMEELGDAIKAVRAKEMPMDEHCPKFTRLEIKLADTIIRIMDYGIYRDLRIAEALLAKVQANLDRPYMHGKKI